MLAPDLWCSEQGRIMDRVFRVNYGDDHDLEWFKEHGHMVTKRNAAETYLPYDGLLFFYYESRSDAGLELERQFEGTGYEWDTSNYCRLPAWLAQI